MSVTGWLGFIGGGLAGTIIIQIVHSIQLDNLNRRAKRLERYTHGHDERVWSRRLEQNDG